MNKKRLLLMSLFSIVLLVLLPGIVSAGCCVTDSGCTPANTQGECSFTYYSDACSDVLDCDSGCCCEPTGGIGRLRYQCAETYAFIPDTSVVIGAGCALCGLNYTLSGTITTVRTGALVAGATVSAGSKSTISRIDGTYTLTGVPGGTNVQVVANKNPCNSGSTTISNLNQDTTVNIKINCDCTPETCNFASNAYCKSNQEWEFYNLTIPAQNTNYCSLCSNDPDCGVLGLCDDGTDGICPIGCTPSTDPDCICSNIANNYCPRGCSPNPSASNYDADCVSLATCGDRYVTYPYETCEDNPFPDQRPLCDAGDCINQGLTGECNCLSLSGCGNLILEGDEECEIGMICPDGGLCENCSCGTPTCVGDAINPSFSTSFNAQTKSILVDWTLLPTCIPSISSYSVHRCHRVNKDDCTDKNSMFSLIADINNRYNTSLLDSNIAGTSEYCYYVQAFYISGELGESDIKCEQTGSYFCMETHSDEFCIDNARAKCDDNYNLEVIEDCKPDKFCMGPDRDEKTKCVEQGVCDLCNGLYGMFAKLDLKVRIQEGEYYYSYYCYYEPTQPYRDVVTGCYLDRTKTLFSAFDYCANINSCYDYKSYDACTDPRDPCGKNQFCRWKWLDNNYHGLGGVCSPINPELQKCDFCDDKEYNWLSPGCTPVVCALFGDCSYQGTSNRVTTCAKQSTLSCLDYDTERDCINGREVHVDANYDINDNRAGGTHQLTRASNDKFGFGKCYWDSANNRCRRNADNYPENNAGNYGHECATGDYYCESDFENPETKIYSSASGCGNYPADVKIRFSVSDNKYSGDDTKTHFCIAPLTSTCYPENLATSDVYEETLAASGTYTVHYYSEDFAKNLEEVQSFNINVDADPPTILEILWPTEDDFPTSLNTVSVNARATTDTVNLCTYTYGSSNKNCINTCAYGQGPPCIDPLTGEFNITVNIPSNGLHDILFDAQDCAGNKATGVSLLAVYRNDTQPAKPLIIIEKAS